MTFDLILSIGSGIVLAVLAWYSAWRIDEAIMKHRMLPRARWIAFGIVAAVCVVVAILLKFDVVEGPWWNAFWISFGICLVAWAAIYAARLVWFGSKRENKREAVRLKRNQTWTDRLIDLIRDFSV